LILSTLSLSLFSFFLRHPDEGGEKALISLLNLSNDGVGRTYERADAFGFFLSALRHDLILSRQRGYGGSVHKPPNPHNHHSASGNVDGFLFAVFFPLFDSIV